MTEPLEIKNNGVLDLHHFSPKDVPVLIEEFIYSCSLSNIYEARIIHGKGTGTLRDIVHAKLKKNTSVRDFWNGDQTNGGWGVTIFSLYHATPQVIPAQDA